MGGGGGTQGRCRYSAISLITRLDFMAPATRVITALQCLCVHISKALNFYNFIGTSRVEDSAELDWGPISVIKYNSNQSRVL